MILPIDPEKIVDNLIKHYPEYNEEDVNALTIVDLENLIRDLDDDYNDINEITEENHEEIIEAWLINLV